MNGFFCKLTERRALILFQLLWYTAFIVSDRSQQSVTLVFKAAKDVKPQRFNQLIQATFSFETNPNKEGKVFQRKSEFVLPAMLFEIAGD